MKNKLFKKTGAALLAIACVIAGGFISAEADETAVPAASAGKIATEHVMADQYEDPFKEYTEPVSGAAELKLSCKSAVLMEQSTGKVLYELNPHEKVAPASITKVMSLLLFMEAIDGGRMKQDDSVSTSSYAASMGGSQIWLEPGELMTVHELLKAVCIASANDATVALAEKVSGSEEAFVARMNERAAELGCADTHFMNASGLDADGHVTSAMDVAIMSRELMKHPKIHEYTSIWMDTLRAGQSKLVNTNKLVC